MARDHFSASVLTRYSDTLTTLLIFFALIDDEKWVEQLSAMLFKGKNIDELTPADMLTVIREMQEKEPDCEHWTFGE